MCPPTYFQVVADKFNDPDLVFSTDGAPDLHEMFTEPIEIRFQDMPGKVTAENKVKKMYFMYARK
jgi:hypothetical protein